jgi:putative ABC transport system ATP-binding protein
VVSINDLKFQYPSGQFQLNIPQFTVADSEKIALIGPSGSGKTTLLNLISGILKPEKGTTPVAEIDVHTLKDDDRRDFRIGTIGFVFQDFELLDYLNVLDNILHPYRITNALELDGTVRNRAVQLADEMGIGDKLRRRPNDLSQGEKQRAAICRALLPRPRLILADEATGNLDPVNKCKILDLMFHSVESHHATLLAVKHDHELLPRFDRVVNFEDFRS